MNAKQFANQVQDLFELPDTFLRLQSLQGSETSSLADYADVIALDPALAARVLKLANSVLYRFAAQIDTLTQAISVIGSEAVVHLALANCTGNMVRTAPKGVIDLDRFWNDSVTAALLMRNLGILNGTKRHERLFITGLLHNLGELVVAQLEPATASSIESETNAGGEPSQIQKQHLGFTYADCSAELANGWKLPDNLVIPIRFQHNPLQTHLFAKEAALMHIALTLTNLISRGESLSQLDDACLALARKEALEPPDLEKGMDYANLELLEVLSILSPGAASII